MKATLLTITGDMAHFKNSRSAALQQTYEIPPISTIIGILKNIYGNHIENFVFGYNFTHLNLQCEITTLYKEVNSNITDSHHDKFKTTPSKIEYLVNPNLQIAIIGLKNNFVLNDVLNLGKTNCLAKLKISNDIEINNYDIVENNIITDIIDGEGIIERENIETIYNERTGCFDYFTKLIRKNDEYTCQYSYELNGFKKGLYLWKYNKVGDIKCYKEII